MILVVVVVALMLFKRRLKEKTQVYHICPWQNFGPKFEKRGTIKLRLFELENKTFLENYGPLNRGSSFLQGRGRPR